MAFNFKKDENQNSEFDFMSNYDSDSNNSNKKSHRNAFEDAPSNNSFFPDNSSTDLSTYNGSNAGNDDYKSFLDSYDYIENRKPKKAKRVRNNNSFKPGISFYDIPWKIILTIVAVVGGGILCYVFRREISDFLSHLFAWAIIFIIIIGIVKWLIFPRRRR